VAVAGLANTGGGGGGSYNQGVSLGADGGSGVVIVSSISTTLSAPTILGFAAGPGTREFIISGSASVGGSIVVEKTTSLAVPITWEPLQTNAVLAGTYRITIPQEGTDVKAFYRLMAQ
jgi:hypothetical protein